MSKILINNQGVDIELLDVGVTIPSTSSYVIPPQNYPLFAASSDTIRSLSDVFGLILNDGGNDILVLSDAIDIIKGWPIQPVTQEETPFFFDYQGVVSGSDPFTVIAYFVPADATAELTRFYYTCRMESFVQILRNGNLIGSLRTGAAMPMASFDWRPNHQCAANDIIEIILTKRVGSPDIDVGAHLMGVQTTI
jgi:hypothetical protein